jgi:hypothetical protein
MKISLSSPFQLALLALLCLLLMEQPLAQCRHQGNNCGSRNRCSQYRPKPPLFPPAYNSQNIPIRWVAPINGGYYQQPPYGYGNGYGYGYSNGYGYGYGNGYGYGYSRRGNYAYPAYPRNTSAPCRGRNPHRY